MTEKVSEPMRLRIASRASCISSLRSSERFSLICLPSYRQGLALATVRIAQFDPHRRARWECGLGNNRKPCRAVLAPRLGCEGAVSYYNLHPLLNTGALY